MLPISPWPLVPCRHQPLTFQQPSSSRLMRTWSQQDLHVQHLLFLYLFIGSFRFLGFTWAISTLFKPTVSVTITSFGALYINKADALGSPLPPPPLPFPLCFRSGINGRSGAHSNRGAKQPSVGYGKVEGG